MTNISDLEEHPDIIEMFKAIKCLRLELDASIVDDVEARFKKALARMESRNSHTQHWYSTRIQRLGDLAKEKGFWDEAACIIANGSAGHHDTQPSYEAILNSYKYRAEQAEKTTSAQLTTKDQEIERMRAQRILLLEAADDALQWIDEVITSGIPVGAPRDKAKSIAQALDNALIGPKEDPHA
jgi:hypothetical protein